MTTRPGAVNQQRVSGMVGVVFGLALILRVAVVLTSSLMLHDDAQGYDQVAQSIAQGHGFSRDGHPTAMEDPLYPAFLAGLYRLGGHHYRLVQLTQAVLNALACALIGVLGAEMGGPIVGWLSGLVMACYPSFVQLPRFLLSEALFIPLLIVALVVCLQWQRTQALRWAIGGGVCFGLAALTRSSVLLLPIVLAGVVWWRSQSADHASRATVRRHALVMLAGLSLTIAPWTLRNLVVMRAFIPISTKGGVDLYSAYFPPEGKRFGLIPQDTNITYARSLPSEVEASRFLVRQTLQWVIHHPLAVLRQVVLKGLFLFTPFDWELLGYRAYNLAYSFMLPWAVMGLLVVRRWRIPPGLFIITIGYYVVLSLLTYGSPRLRLPIEPLFIICAVVGCLAFVERIQSHVVRGVTLGAWCALNVSLWLEADALRLTLQRLLNRVGLW